MIDWLNANASAVTGLTAIVTAIATIVLAVLTVIYIRQNGKMIDQNDRTIKAMQDQLDLALKIHEQDRRDLQEAEYRSTAALRALANRLLASLTELPFPEPEFDRLHRAAIWSSDDLNELEALARAAKIGVYAAADAVRHLNAIAEFVRRVRAIDQRTGMGFGDRDREMWKRDVASASRALTQIIGSARVEMGAAGADGSLTPTA